MSQAPDLLGYIYDEFQAKKKAENRTAEDKCKVPTPSAPSRPGRRKAKQTNAEEAKQGDAATATSTTLLPGCANEALDFLNFAREFLAKNPPISIDYMTPGLGVVMPDGRRFSLYPDNTSDYQMYQGEVAITHENRRGYYVPAGSNISVKI